MYQRLRNLCCQELLVVAPMQDRCQAKRATLALQVGGCAEGWLASHARKTLLIRSKIEYAG